MTWYYVYAIALAETSLSDDLSGIFGETLRLVHHAELAAVVGEGPETLSRSDPTLILKHHQVVSELCARYSALPARFGSKVRGADRIRTGLEERQESLAADLERLSGKVEFGITIPGETSSGDSDHVYESETSIDSATSGSDYMKRRLNQFQRENETRAGAEKIHKALSLVLDPYTADESHEFLPRAGILLRASYLVEISQSQLFQHAAEAFQDQSDSLEVVLVGPWPPYSFVSRNGPDIAGMLGAISS
ncbi:MAG: hypothetical protein EA415_08465 [Sphaerobacteraceae bacterium]|nr:MAG: hypothetical protein EA415_08465 [Sphaerobacteraceae bacterium]